MWTRELTFAGVAATLAAGFFGFVAPLTFGADASAGAALGVTATEFVVVAEVPWWVYSLSPSFSVSTAISQR